MSAGKATAFWSLRRHSVLLECEIVDELLDIRRRIYIYYVFVYTKSKVGKVLLTNEDEMKRWTEHFHEVLNQHEPTILFNFDQESNIACTHTSVQDVTAQEVIKAINSQKNNKSPGLGGISAELLKHGKYIGRGTDTVIQYHLA